MLIWNSLCSLGWLQTKAVFLTEPPKCWGNRPELPGEEASAHIGSEESGSLWPTDQCFYGDEMNRKHDRVRGQWEPGGVWGWQCPAGELVITCQSILTFFLDEQGN